MRVPRAGRYDVLGRRRAEAEIASAVMDDWARFVSRAEAVRKQSHE